MALMAYTYYPSQDGHEKVTTDPTPTTRTWEEAAGFVRMGGVTLIDQQDDYNPGWYFPSIDRMPNGITIDSATLFLTGTSKNGTPGGTLRFRSQDNATPWNFGGSSDFPSQVGGTVASTSVVDGDLNAAGEYDLDCTSIVQEIVNRAGWASGNAMAPYIIATQPSDNRIDNDEIENDSEATRIQIVVDDGLGATAIIQVEESSGTILNPDDTSAFGSDEFGQTTTKTYTIREVGGSTAINITSIAFTAGDTGQWDKAGTTDPTSVTAGGTATFTRRYLRTAPGSHSATLRITSDAGKTEFDIELTGTATGTAGTPGSETIKLCLSDPDANWTDGSSNAFTVNEPGAAVGAVFDAVFNSVMADIDGSLVSPAHEILTIDYNATWFPGTASWSALGTFNPDVVATGGAKTIFAFGTDAASSALLRYNNDGDLLFVVDDGSSDIVAEAVTAIVVDRAFFWSVTYDASDGSMTLYVRRDDGGDGAFSAAATATASNGMRQDLSPSFVVGAEHTGSFRGANAKQGKVKLFKGTVLTPSQILTEWNSGEGDASCDTLSIAVTDDTNGDAVIADGGNLNFGSQIDTGGSDIDRPITLTNDGNKRVTIDSTEVTGADAAAFSLPTDIPDSTNIDPIGNTDNITVRCDVSQLPAGSADAQLVITYNTTETHTINLVAQSDLADDARRITRMTQRLRYPR